MVFYQSKKERNMIPTQTHIEKHINTKNQTLLIRTNMLARILSALKLVSILHDLFSFSYYLFSNQTDHIINQTTKQHLKKYDKHLKKFNATKALDEALAVNFSFKIFSNIFLN